MTRAFIFTLVLMFVILISQYVDARIIPENSPDDYYDSGNTFKIEDSIKPQSQLTKKLPQAIIIGAKKCGTRALLKFIGAHPNVSTAGAEVHFFDRFYHMGLDWYR
jgi:hypothetical protein